MIDQRRCGHLAALIAEYAHLSEASDLVA
jgi:hypothetical protein